MAIKQLVYIMSLLRAITKNKMQNETCMTKNITLHVIHTWTG